MKPLILIGGCPRSGTTMFRMMMDSHPHIHCGPEFKIIPCLANWVKSRQEVIRQGLQGYGGNTSEFMRYLGASIEMYLNHAAQEAGKQRAAEKTPTNAVAWQGIRSMFPASPRISLVRNPMHVVGSLLKQQWLGENGQPINECRSAESAAEWWLNSTRNGFESGCLEVLYEELVDYPSEQLRRVCEYIDEPFSDEMLNWYQSDHGYAQNERISHGKELNEPAQRRKPHGLSERDAECVRRICGDVAERYGYDLQRAETQAGASA